MLIYVVAEVQKPQYMEEPISSLLSERGCENCSSVDQQSFSVSL
jgi:hypothetical protein